MDTTVKGNIAFLLPMRLFGGNNSLNMFKYTQSELTFLERDSVKTETVGDHESYFLTKISSKLLERFLIKI